MGEALRGEGRQSPGLTLDPTAQRSPNKVVWRLKRPKCQQLYRTTDVMMTTRLLLLVPQFKKKQDKSDILKAFGDFQIRWHL